MELGGSGDLAFDPAAEEMRLQQPMHPIQYDEPPSIRDQVDRVVQIHRHHPLIVRRKFIGVTATWFGISLNRRPSSCHSGRSNIQARSAISTGSVFNSRAYNLSSRHRVVGKTSRTESGIAATRSSNEKSGARRSAIDLIDRHSRARYAIAGYRTAGPSRRTGDHGAGTAITTTLQS
jgi:hypothetical protein